MFFFMSLRRWMFARSKARNVGRLSRLARRRATLAVMEGLEERMLLTTIPSITAQPLDTQVIPGTTVAIISQATADGETPTVQWQQSTNGGSSWSDISGATNQKLELSPAFGATDYQVHAVWTTTAGSTTSNAAAISITNSIYTMYPVNNGFELPNLGAGGYATNPSGATWTFTGYGGISANGSPYGTTGATNGNQNPAGTTSSGGQAALVQSYGSNPSISQTMILPGSATIVVNFAIEQREGNAQSMTVYIDDVSLGTFTTASTSSFVSFQSQPTTLATAGNHTLRFSGNNPTGGDNTLFLDDVSLTVSAPPTITTQPQNAYVHVGDTATFTAAATGVVTPTVQWQQLTTNAASFRTNTTTSGNWKGVFGSEGYNVINDSVNYPAYATVTPTGYNNYTWANPTSDPRALQYAAPGSTDRIAGVWYTGGGVGDNFTVNVNLTDNQYHAVSFYLLDWDRGNRSEQIDVIDTASGQTIDSRTFTNFQEGEYATWNVKGNIAFKFSNLVQGWNAVLTGIFFDSAWTNIPGATSTSYTTPAFSLADDGTGYRAVFSSTLGSATTNEVSILQDAAAAITTQPSSAYYAIGTTATLTAAASGNPTPTVQWQSLSTASGSSWTDIPGATSATYTTGILTQAESGYQYRAIFSNTGGSATTSAATLTAGVAPSVTTQPADTLTPSGRSATFTAVASGLPTPTVQWQTLSSTNAASFRTDSTTSGNWKGVFGSDGYNIINDSVNYPAYATVTPAGYNNYTWADYTTDTRALLKAAPGSTTRIAGVWYTGGNVNDYFSINVNLTDNQYHAVSFYLLNWDNGNRPERIDVIDQSSGQTIDSQSFTNFGNGQYATWNVKGNVTFNFVNLLTGSSAVLTGIFFDPAWTNIPGATSTSYSTPAVSMANDGAQYRAVFTNSIGTTTSDIATLSVASAPTVTSQPQNGGGIAGSTVTFTAAAAGTPVISAQWQEYSGGSWNNIPGATSTSYSVTASAGNDGTQYRVIFSNSYGSVTSDPATLSLYRLSVTTQPADTATGAGSTATFTASVDAVPAATVQWQVLPARPATNAASFRIDTTTSGNWKGVYGAQGYNVFNDAESYPAYATVTPTGYNNSTWANPTSDTRALQYAAPGSTDRIAGVWYSGGGVGDSFTVNANLTDGQVHAVSFYLLDWDSYSRSERIELIDNTTGNTLDSQTFSNFHDGTYATWNVQGNVSFRFVNLVGGWNAVLTGLFIDKPGWTNIDGATSTSYTTPTVYVPDTGSQYRAVFTNPAGTVATNPATLTVNGLSTTTSLASSATNTSYGDPVTFTATVTSGATGTVTFMNGGVTLGTANISGSTATLTTSAVTGGVNSITAVYQGDNYYASSTSNAVSLTVQKVASTTTLISSSSQSNYGDPLTFTATVPAGATGTVAFMDGTTTLGTATISGTTATFITTTLNVGSYSVTAVYAGDISFYGSTSNAVSQTVSMGASSTSLSSSRIPSNYGEPVTLTALIRADATGTITFNEPGVGVLGTSIINAGVATFTTSALSVGSHTFIAIYDGNSNIHGSVSNDLTQIVSAASTPAGYLLQGAAGSYQVPLNGNAEFIAASVSQGVLPAGLSLSSAGVISGTPAAGTVGTYSLTVTLTPPTGPAYDLPITLTVLANRFVDPNPSVNNRFGDSVVALTNGNVVVTAPSDDAGGTNAGAVYLFNGVTGALISTLTGSSAYDFVGSDGVTALANGNFVVQTSSWRNGTVDFAGAVTWGSGVTGVSGVVSSANSLVGSNHNDKVGSGGITTLPNGNYVVSSHDWNNGTTQLAGAVTWGNGLTGITGVVSSTNSLVGSSGYDYVGFGGVTALENGNYVIGSPYWSSNKGAVTWASGTTAITGLISSENSLVGSVNGDYVGGFNITLLTNGNYVVVSKNWSNGGTSSAGAITWASGTSGITGVVSSDNSLVGSTFNDQVGSGGVTPLANGNYVVDTSRWNSSTAGRVGAVTWGSGTSGITGVVSSDNSLVGSTSNDFVGENGVIALTNGNYVVNSSRWTNGTAAYAGAVTWGNGQTGITGFVSSDNSLVGTSTYDFVGGKSVIALTNGNYVVASDSWNNGTVESAGAITWGNGLTGITGVITSNNSLIGSTRNDALSVNGLTALSNGNYVICSTDWTNGTARSAGAVTWGNGLTGITGFISSANSLVGTAEGDYVGGEDGVVVLTNGNYVVHSPEWSNGTIDSAGAVTWGNGLTGTTGEVSSNNSLVGTTDGENLGGDGVVPLTNGNYVVINTHWSNGTATRAGAVTWGSGTAGITGVITSANSLVGVSAKDSIGHQGVTALPNGHYLVLSRYYSNGTAGSSGAVTWGNGYTGQTTGEVSGLNSLVGPFTGPFSNPFNGWPSIDSAAGIYLMPMNPLNMLATGSLTASTTTTVTSSASPSAYGSSVTFTATVSNGAFGTVTFMDGPNNLGTATISNGVATLTTPALAVGTHNITVVYGGNSAFDPSTSSVLSQTVNKSTTTTSLVSSANPSRLGSSVTFTATVTSGAAGTVTFKDGATVLGTGTINGTTATFSTSTLTAGSHAITAVYGGDGGHIGSTSAVLTQVVAAAPLVTANPTAEVVNSGARVTFTATAIGNPTPTVQWQLSTNGGTTWANISGATSTSYTTPALTGANDGSLYRAVFMNNLGSATTSVATLRVNQAPAITRQPASVTTNSGSTATFSAAASGTPTPTVQWQKNTGTGWNDIPGATSASYTTPSLTSGDTGSQYRAVFTNVLGTATTSPATLTVAVVANVSSTSVGWGTQIANLVDMGDGRLLPAGRTTSIPWLGINKIYLTLDQSVNNLVASDITLRSAGGYSYSVSSVSAVNGSNGTIWIINLGGTGLANPDKVTVTVGNSNLASYSKRLDVLPGDVNDDGLVSSLDQMLVSRGLTGQYIVFYDIDGTGTLNSNDVSTVKSRIGNKLP